MARSKPNTHIDPLVLAAAIERYGPYVTYPTAAEITTASVRTLKRLTRDGQLPMYTVGSTRTYRLKIEDVLGIMKRAA